MAIVHVPVDRVSGLDIDVVGAPAVPIASAGDHAPEPSLVMSSYPVTARLSLALHETPTGARLLAGTLRVVTTGTASSGRIDMAAVMLLRYVRWRELPSIVPSQWALAELTVVYPDAWYRRSRSA
jgi:hypothetical protein